MRSFADPSSTPPYGPDRKEPGRLTALLMRWLFRQATVAKVEALSEHVRLITLAGESLKTVEWIAGQKIQIAVGGNANRTYTPISWDVRHGETRLLAFSHGDGPGSVWASTVRVGEMCQFFGPRPSLDLDGLGELPFLFGDETSFGLAQALCAKRAPSGTGAFLFEVTSVEASEQVWHASGMPRAIFVQRAEHDAHLAEIEAQTLKILTDWAPANFVLTGKASSIQCIGKLLKKQGVTSSRLKAKAYWAPGKAGLD